MRNRRSDKFNWFIEDLKYFVDILKDPVADTQIRQDNLVDAEIDQLSNESLRLVQEPAAQVTQRLVRNGECLQRFEHRNRAPPTVKRRIDCLYVTVLRHAVVANKSG